MTTIKGARQLLRTHRDAMEACAKRLIDTVVEKHIEIVIDHAALGERCVHVVVSKTDTPWFEVEEYPELRFYYHNIACVGLYQGFIYVELTGGI